MQASVDDIYITIAHNALIHYNIDGVFFIMVNEMEYENAKIAAKRFNHDMKHEDSNIRCCVKRY